MSTKAMPHSEAGGHAGEHREHEGERNERLRKRRVRVSAKLTVEARKRPSKLNTRRAAHAQYSRLVRLNTIGKIKAEHYN